MVKQLPTQPMSEPSTPVSEELSALMDGELQPDAQSRAMAAVLSESTYQSRWHTYHLTGDILRSADLAPTAQDLDFLSRLEARLAREQVATRPAVLQDVQPYRTEPRGASANGARWWLVAGMAASVLAVVAGISLWMPQTNGEQFASALTPVAPVVEPDAVAGPDGMIRDPRLDELLNAHQQLGGHSALQMPAGFLRNATYEGAGR